MSTNHQMAKDRATSFFDIYLLLGPERSLTKLQQVLADSGLSVTLTTLKSYSANYQWQQRVSDGEEAARSAKAAKGASSIISELNERQSRLGFVMQGLAERNLVQNIATNLATLSPRDTVYMADMGSKMERLARGEATTRWAVATEVISPVVYNIVQLFQQVNNYEDVGKRQREFAIGCDEILEQAVGPLGADDV